MLVGYSESAMAMIILITAKTAQSYGTLGRRSASMLDGDLDNNRTKCYIVTNI